ncbi:MAG: PDZ domain-containing protein [Flavobacteriales bacterium]
MKKKLRQHVLEISFLMVLTLGLVAIAKAQSPDKTQPQKKVRVEVEVTENGKTSTSVQELTLDRESITGQLDEMIEEIEMILEEAVQDIEQTDLEITIRRNETGTSRPPHGPRYHRHMSVFPDAPIQWDSEGEKRAFLGVVANGLDSTELVEIKKEKAVRITRVVEGSAAEKAGLQEDDIVVKIGDENIGSFSQLAKEIKSNEPGDEIEITLLRNGKEEKVKATLGESESRAYHFEFHDIDAPRPPHPPGVPNAPNWNYKYQYDYDYDYDYDFGDESDLEEKAFLGIVGSSMGEDKGVMVTKVFEGSTASVMGLKEGDKIYELDDKEISNVNDLVEHLNNKKVGEELKVEYEREGKKLKQTGTLGNKAEHRERVSEHMRDGQHQVRMRIRIETLSSDEIRELNKKSGKTLDENNSLELAGLNFSPNPTDGLFRLRFELPDEGDTEIQVFDQNGKQVYLQELTNFSGIYSNQISIEDQPSGVYFISINQNGKGMVAKMVKN